MTDVSIYMLMCDEDSGRGYTVSRPVKSFSSPERAAQHRNFLNAQLGLEPGEDQPSQPRLGLSKDDWAGVRARLLAHDPGAEHARLDRLSYSVIAVEHDPA